MGRPKFALKSTPSRGPILKPHYLPHPWTRPTYDAKRHPDPIRRFSTMHWTDRRTDRPTDRPRESLMTILSPMDGIVVSHSCFNRQRHLVDPRLWFFSVTSLPTISSFKSVLKTHYFQLDYDKSHISAPLN